MAFLFLGIVKLLEMKFVFLFLVLIYFGINIYVNSKISKAYYLQEERRKIHKLLIWIIPFLGALMIRSHWKKRDKNDIKVVTKTSRKNKSGGFYESGIGMSGE